MRELKSCPVCGSTKIRRSYSSTTTRSIDQRTWDVDVCDDCTHGFMNPQPTWEELAPYYAPGYQAYDTKHGGEGRGSDDEILATAKGEGEFRHVHIKPGQRVLDVGCGAGFFLRIASQLGALCEGVEPSPIAADLARSAGVPIFNGNLEEFVEKFPEKRFDLITSNHVVEHVPNPIEVLTDMRRLLAPGGRIWISVPNAACDYCRTLKGVWHSADLPFHLMQFTPESMRLAGERAGLEVDTLDTFSVPSSTAASIRQMLRHRYYIPRRLLQRMGSIDTKIAPRKARQMDAVRQGEAILVTFRSQIPDRAQVQ